MKTLIFRSGILLLLLGLCACGGTKVLKEPEPMVVAQPLAAASDQNLCNARLGYLSRRSRYVGEERGLGRVPDKHPEPGR